MPKRTHADYPGAWWHVTNRGIAKRAVFENGQDFEAFLDLLGALVERRLVEIHAYSLLTTHFHLLVRSVDATLAEAMQWLLLQYVRYFNRSRRRDGSLFRGRYKARLIEDVCYWENTLRYIDRNPVEAGMSGRPEDYPFGSAAAHHLGVGPTWLSREEVARAVREHCGATVLRPADYDRFLAATPAAVVEILIEGHLGRSRNVGSQRIFDLIRSASRRQQNWFAWKAQLADGTRVGQPILPASHITRLVTRLQRVLDEPAGGSRTRCLQLLHAALLRELCGQGYAQIAQKIGIATSTAHAHLRRHRRLAEEDASYEQLLARLIDLAVRRGYARSVNKIRGWAPL